MTRYDAPDVANRERTRVETTPTSSGPALPIADYDRLLLADLEVRLRQLSDPEVERLVEHERAGPARPSALVLLEQRRAQLRREAGRR